jgi:SAM-dependent methyltransferase
VQAIDQQVGEIWDKKFKAQKSSSRHWWQWQAVYDHIGRKINGSFPKFIQAETGNRRFERGISVGCGSGRKEFRLLQAGIVEHFDLYELSQERIASGRERASALGLESRATFHLADAFKAASEARKYDFVHWDNSLHHMFDAHAAIKWSRHVLVDRGAFVMDDFVGPSRFQWSDRNLDLVADFRARLPVRLLRKDGTDALIPVRPARKAIRKMIEMDPSEAADSARILPSIRKIFPDANIVLTGGAIYHLGLGGGIYENLDSSSEEDLRILDSALELDDLAIKQGETHYAVCVAFK